MVTAEQVRKLLRAHGKLRPQPASDWVGQIPLPEGVGSFYSEIGPVDITIQGHGNPTFIPRLKRLWKHQAGYRWNGLTKEEIPEWNSDWLVVADEGGDPFILSISSGVILFAHHGEGLWEPIELFPDITTMTACIATLGLVVVEAGDSFLNEDFSVADMYRADAVERLTRILGSKSQAESVIGIAGWGPS